MNVLPELLRCKKSKKRAYNANIRGSAPLFAQIAAKSHAENAD
jgi:hypothetical protein